MQTSAVLILLLQITLILVASRLMGIIASALRQPQVVGQMVAGILLGPSLLGWLAPNFSATIFPPAGVGLLNVLAQIGVIFFLFLIGLELDPKKLRGQGHAALVISHASIVTPFLLGAGLTYFLYPLLFNNNQQMRFTAAALFMGAAMSITAFPVLARILTERSLHKTTVGTVALACAAVDDVTAWCILAFVVAIGRAEGFLPALLTLSLAGGYVGLMMYIGRPLLARLAEVNERRGGASQGVFVTTLILVLLSAAATEYIGIHALFGAFFMGVMMPKQTRFVHYITDKLESVTVLFLLPIFFAYAGLRTQIGLLDSYYLWGLTGLIVLVACLGKFGGATLAALASGMRLRESTAIGILMNTRGLMELVILTLGLQLGVISDLVFAMMVIMALVTTAMTTPILSLVYPPRLYETDAVNPEQAAREFGIVIPVSRAESGIGLARIASAIAAGDTSAKVYALSLRRPIVPETLGVTLPSPAADDDLLRPLGPLLQETKTLNLPSETIAFLSRDIASDIDRVARAKRADLVLIGYHNPVFSAPKLAGASLAGPTLGGAKLGGTVHRVLTGTDADVGVFIDRGLRLPASGPTNATPHVLDPINPIVLKVLLPLQGASTSTHDDLALTIAARMAGNPAIEVTVLQILPASPTPAEAAMPPLTLPASAHMHLQIIRDDEPVEALLRHAVHYQLLIVGLTEEWGLASYLFGLQAERIAEESPASLLLLRRHIPTVELSS